MKKKVNFKKTFLITLIVSLSISALIGIFVFLFGDFGETEFRLLMTTLTIGGYSLTGLCCSVLYEKRKFSILALSGMILSVIGFLFTVLVIWEAIGLEDSWKTLMICIILAFSTAQSCLLLLVNPEKTLVKGSLSATIIFISIVALMLIKLVLNEFDDASESYFRILGVFAILDVLGTIVTPILNKVCSMRH
ncbi:hypothetical protein J4410_02865 [Candidatus Woesearchaeota archaeon]|nr:hypothetical protein [Candidatus Woesearchaeota archaeon]